MSPTRRQKRTWRRRVSRAWHTKNAARQAWRGGIHEWKPSHERIIRPPWERD